MDDAIQLTGVPDTKDGREKQAANEVRRQRQREINEALNRGDEPEPAILGEDGESPEFPLICHRRNCEELAEFLVLERYQEETGHGAVEGAAVLCREHTDEESPTNLDGAYEDYVFRVVPLPESWTAEHS